MYCIIAITSYVHKSTTVLREYIALMIGILISTLILLLTPNCVCFLSEYGELTNPDGLATMTIHKPEICIAQAQKHDIVSYHYIGRLASDSSIFGRR